MHNIYKKKEKKEKKKELSSLTIKISCNKNITPIYSIYQKNIIKVEMPNIINYIKKDQ